MLHECYFKQELLLVTRLLIYFAITYIIMSVKNSQQSGISEFCSLSSVGIFFLVNSFVLIIM